MWRLTLAIAVLISLYTVQAEEGLTAEVFFKSIAGHWIGSGQLVNADGEVTDIQEDWTGAFSDDGSFEMKGTRIWGEDQQEFYWRFTHNASLDLNECEYWHTGIEEPVRFEVSLTDTSVEMKSPFGEPGGELKVSNTLVENKIEGEVSLVQGNGIEVLSGKVEHLKADGGDE
ncbi:MAG: hypothetical protein P1U58_11985 [Verrucomicrobiales bacterium]|nr:hypothetical protein [Verrucomicrobiales bacterium]